MLHEFRKYLHYAARVLSAFIVAAVSFIILVQIPAFVDNDGEVISITSPIPILVPLALAAGVYLLLKKPLNKSKYLYNPDLFKAQAQLYADIFSQHYTEALRANSVIPFLDAWAYVYVAHDWLLGISSKAPAQYRDLLSWQKGQLTNFQWGLRDAIDRSATSALRDLNHAYKNNKKARLDMFFIDIDYGRFRYSDETRMFAGEKLKMVSSKYGLPIPDELKDYFNDDTCVDTLDINCAMQLDIDTMDGHDFEHWCASLLEKLGYSDVQVTRGSGDQGVDVLAKKDGIRYAVQCKRYSSDLGNTPVQEVNAGKTIYHCHVGAVLTNRHFTKGALEAAEATGVLLWDREWIMNAIEMTNK